MHRRSPARAVAVVAALLACSCAEGGAPRDEATIGIESAPASLDPRFAVDASGSRIADLLHCSLVVPDGRGGWTGDLASSWSMPDPRTLVFVLDGTRTFHDGAPVTAADVAATLGSILDPSTASPKRAAFTSVESVEAGPGSPPTVTLRLGGPDAAVLEAAAVGILPAALARGSRLEPGPGPARDGSGASSLPGCGAWRLHSRSPAGDTVLEAVPAPPEVHGAIRRLRFRVLPDAVTRTLLLEAGQLDLVQNALEPDAAAWLARRDGDVRVHLGDYDAFQYLGVHHRHPALADRRVRRALALAIDREAIVRHLLLDQAVTATGLLPPHHRDHEPRVRRWGHDPGRAGRLLDRAGFQDPDAGGPAPRFELRYATTTVELRRRIAEAIASDLGKVGIRVSIESREWGTFLADLAAGNFDLYSLAWVGIRDGDLYRTSLHSQMVPPSGSNRGFVEDRRLDRLLEAQKTGTDPAQRRRVLSRIQKRTARTLPVIPLWWPKAVVATSARLRGFAPHPSGDLRGLGSALLLEP